MREKIAWALAATLGLLVLAAVAGVTEGGPLDPPGSPASTDSVRLPGTPIEGLPFSASQPGHYYLTGNVTGSAGISVTSDNVSIDLGGFTLNGLGAGFGIIIDPAKTGTSIRNGSVRNWQVGIRQFVDGTVDADIVIEDIAVANSTGVGIQITGRSRLRNCSVANAGGNGIEISSPTAVVENCAVRGAAGIGMQISGSATVRGCEVTGVTTVAGIGAGLFLSSESVVEDCWIHDNVVNGAMSIGASGIASRITIENNTKAFQAISLGQGAVLRDSVIRGNTGGTAGVSGFEAVVIENTVVESNGGIGIDVDAGATVRNNTVGNNGGDGILAGPRSLIEGNAVADNGADGIEVSTDARVIDNAVRLNGDDAAVADGAGIRLTGAGNYVTGNVLSSNDIGIRSLVAPSVIVRNSARNNTVANYQTQATDLTGVLITVANEVANSVQHYNDAP